jgi:hypothetical protein
MDRDASTSANGSDSRHTMPGNFMTYSLAPRLGGIKIQAILFDLLQVLLHVLFG